MTGINCNSLAMQYQIAKKVDNVQHLRKSNIYLPFHSIERFAKILGVSNANEGKIPSFCSLIHLYRNRVIGQIDKLISTDIFLLWLSFLLNFISEKHNGP